MLRAHADCGIRSESPRVLLDRLPWRGARPIRERRTAWPRPFDFGMTLWVKAGDVRRTAKVLGAS